MPSVVVTMLPWPDATSRSVTRNHTSDTPIGRPPRSGTAANLARGRHYRLRPCSTCAASGPNPTPSAPGSPGAAATRRRRSIGSSSSTRSSARLGTQRDELRARIKVLSKEVGQRRGQGDAEGAEALMAESRALGDEEKALDAEADGLAAELRELLLRTPEPAVGRLPRRRRRAGQRGAAHRGLRPGRLRRPPARAALGHRHRARDPRRRAGRQDRRLDVHAVPRLGRPAAAGDGAAEPRPQRRRLRGAAAAHPRAHRHDDRHRPPAEVRGRGVPHGARRPLGDPHRRGPAHLAAPRRGARRGRPPAPLHRAHVVLPAGGGRGRARHAGAAAGARVRQGRAARASPPAPSRRSPARRTSSPAARRCSPSSACRTASSTSAPATSARRRPARGTSRRTRRGATCGSR